MAEAEAVIEQRLIDQLCSGESQWTYRPDIKTEEQLWANFKYILEQNNKAKLDDTPLSEFEFAKVKNDLSHASFYDAAKWLAGDHGRVEVHVPRGNETLHLLVMNNEHVAGGSSVYEVINQYQAFAEEPHNGQRNRRFDVTLLINGLPMIHIELKNREHSYMEGFNQIKKYIEEGKFTDIFSNVQMFVVSNAVDTKYFAAARGPELNKKFLSGWLNEKNNPVSDYLDFARNVLKIPHAHEMVTKYVVLDNDKKKLLLLRPYQIHAIEAMRAASKRGESGFIWHTTGSGKTMTSYKATRNLLMDIPSIKKTIFLIDRKDLDTQTGADFKSYAGNDTIDVDNTEDVGDLIRKLTDNTRHMIVTTRQKMQTMIRKRLKEGSRESIRIRDLRVAFVVDECHRAVTPETKRQFEKFFPNSLWYGFTGTPIFDKNKYEVKGDLPQTTEELYGKKLHSYTIKEAIHDEAVLGFMVETLGPKNQTEDPSIFESNSHMRSVLDTILNHSYHKFGMQNGKGETYEAILTVDSIPKGQRYYKLLKSIKEGRDELKISEQIRQALPDFPKFAITYSLTENEEKSMVNQDEMKESLKDYNKMFGTHYTIDSIIAYNDNLNERLARKGKNYLDRHQQLDLVIVVDRLLTGFDAPCLSTLFVDRQPMKPQHLIQAFSRTNRLFDANKQYGQIVTFQNPDGFKTAINEALELYSLGGEGIPLSEDWDTVKESFIQSVHAIHALAGTPKEVKILSREQKKAFIHLFRKLDHDFAHIKAFTRYDESLLKEYQFSEAEYEDYAGMYKNVLEELKGEKESPEEEDEPVIDDYELVAYNKLRIDFEYIVELLQGFIESLDPIQKDFTKADFEKKIQQLREIIEEFGQTNQKLGDILNGVLDQIIQEKDQFIGLDVSILINQMRYAAINREITAFAEKWYLRPEDVRYEVFNYKNGTLANENNLKEKANYTAYKENTDNPLLKFKFRKTMIEDFKHKLMQNILPLLNN